MGTSKTWRYCLMKAYFVAPQKDFSQLSPYYKATVALLNNAGVELTNPWIKEYERKDNSVQLESAKYYQESMRDIASADFVIFDVTISSMSVGHQMTYALYMQKPTLLLVNVGVKKGKDLFVGGSTSPFLKIIEYKSVDDIEKSLMKFIRDNTRISSSRLNLSLNKKQANYLSWAAYTYKLTKTKIVQNALDDAIYGDKEYRKWIDKTI